MSECRVISGVEAEMNDSCFMPRFLVYHFVVEGMERTVRTRWSKERILVAGLEGEEVEVILMSGEWERKVETRVGEGLMDLRV